jgi:hypothetical protein
MCADLRGSRKTEKYKNKYDNCVKEFQQITNKTINDNGKCVFKPFSYEGENIKVLFFNPWPDIASVSALYIALCLHEEIKTAGFNSHGLAIGINWGLDESEAFADAMYLINFIGKEYQTPPFDSKIIITEKVFNFLSPPCQKFFRYIGEKNIAKRKDDNQILKDLFEFGFDMDAASLLKGELKKFFDIGLIGILPEGLWPNISSSSSGNSEFFKYLTKNTRHEIKILQTYVPGMDIIKDSLGAAIERKVNVQILLLKQKWKITDEIKELIKNIRIPKGVNEIDSPLAYQRGKDFDYKRPLQFSSEINTCTAALDSLREGLYKFYNATPSVCIHIFDNVMFIGNFLQKRFAISTPHFVVVRGSKLFSCFENEFNQIWNKKTTKINR